MQKTAMVVDDSRVARMTLKKLLKAADFDVIEYYSAEEALAYLQSASVLPQIIFMDVMMDGMDGLTATRNIKANPEWHDIPVVMCTGNDSSDDLDKAREVGAVTALTKPPVASQLSAILEKIDSLPAATPEDEGMAATASATFDQQAFEQQMMEQIRQQLLPQLQQSLESMAANQCQQQIRQQLATQLKEMEARLRQQLTPEFDSLVNETVRQVGEKTIQEIAADHAYQAVKTVVEEADIPAQISDYLSHKGEEWLVQQEDDLGQQLSEQLERLIPQRVSESLDTVVQDSVQQQLQNLSASIHIGEAQVKAWISEALEEFAAISRAGEADEQRAEGMNEAQVQQQIQQALKDYETSQHNRMLDMLDEEQVKFLIRQQLDAVEVPDLNNELIQQQLTQLQGQLATLKGITFILGLLVIALLFVVLI